MARILTCGFEENNFAATMWTTVSGSPTLQTITVRSGTYAMTIDDGVQESVTRNLSVAVTSGTYFTRFYWQASDVTPLGTRVLADGAGAGVSWRLQITTAGVLQLLNGVSGSVVVTGPTLAINTWYRIEVRHLLSDTVGELELRVDGTSYGSQTGADTLNGDMSRFVFGGPTAAGGLGIYDDIIINDATGVAPFNTWPGGSKIALAEPGGEVSMQWEDGATANPSLFSNVDDLPGAPDDATTYNKEDDTASQVDRMTLATLPVEIPSDANMIALDMYMRVGSTATTARDITNKIWDEASVLTNGPLIAANINGWRIASVGPTNEHQVFDLGARTKANVQDFDVGYDNNSVQATRERRVTALWVNVEWIEGAPPSGPAAGLRTLALTGVGL